MFVIIRNNDEHFPASAWLPWLADGLWLAYRLGHWLIVPSYEYLFTSGQLIDDIWQLRLSLFDSHGIHDGTLCV
jgi:hypothetical protein